MKELIKKRVIEEANIIVNTHMTIRELTKIMGVSKSTIHHDMKVTLKLVDSDLYNKVQAVFNEHIRLRHYLGGLSTKKKYKKII